MQAVLDEVIVKVAQLFDEDRDELIRILQEQKIRSTTNGGQKKVSISNG